MAKCESAFLMFYDWERAFEMLPDHEFKKMVMAMYAYSKRGTEPPAFEGISEAVACFVFPAMQRHSDRVKIGRAGGRKRAENAVANNEYANQGISERRASEQCEDEPKEKSSQLEDNSNITSSQLEVSLRDVSTTKTKTKTETKTETKQYKDEDRNNTAREDCADVSSVIGLAREICDWIDIPMGLTPEMKQRIEGSGGTLDDYRRLFEIANESKFLRGGGDRGWKASLEWLIEHKHEVTAGKYRTWEKSDNVSQSDYYDTSRYENLTW